MAKSKFVHGTSYPIETLPDDLHDETIPNRDRWALKDALFWNDCQGWWIEHICDVRGSMNRGQAVIARFWSPLPPHPMTRQQVVEERGWTICPGCDCALTPALPHRCKGPSEDLIKERRLQATADAKS
jgi:hypothetical protein